MRSLVEANQAAAVYWTARRESVGISYVARDGTTETTARELQVVGPMLEELIEPGGRILDFGCGYGRFGEILRQKAASYDGVDLIPGLSTLDWDFETLPGGYDEVLAAFVLQHISDPEAYAHWVQQLHDCLKPGGILIVVDHEPLHEPVHEPVEELEEFGEHMVPRGLFAVLEGVDWMGSKFLPMDYPDHWFAMFVKRPIELPETDAPEFEEDDAGLVFARTIPMPDRIAISRKFLEPDSHDRRWVLRDGDVINMRFANGRWVYRIVGWGGHGQDVAVAELEYSE